ncbi:S1 family peptidase [Kutzneria chonburiensis]|uniref:S1 family peptidase n=1 Tax=Kutzneria chonburiensis TaxID=1483604 RepID=UPI0023620524|nr:trypsin-like serine protease [Kutzneria chonburiensis]
MLTSGSAAQRPRVVTVPSTTTTTTKPGPSAVLPFNAKLTSQDIPTPGGGLRSGACSGSLIAPEWVVTAGHCFHDVNDTRIGGTPQYHMTVVLGKLKDSDPGGESAQVVDVRQSPVNDLAVVKLDRPITDITPLALANKPPTVGLPLQFAGWGSTSPTVVAPSDHLKRGQFRVAVLHNTVLDAEPTVARTVENSPCPDDSGGPFFVSADNVTGTLVAIVDNGPACPQPGLEVVARVDVVFSWIHQQIDPPR